MDDGKRRELVEVLDEYDGVTYDRQQAVRDKEIEFWVRGKRILWAIDMAESDARDSLRKELSRIGARRRWQPGDIKPPPILSPSVSPPPASPSMATAIPPKPEPKPAPEPPTAKPASTPASTEPPRPSVPQPTNPLGEIVLHSERVLAIVLDADLVIEKDNVLVIPLQKPESPIPVSIPVDQFNLWKWLLEERARPATRSAQPAFAPPAAAAPEVVEEVNEIPLPPPTVSSEPEPAFDGDETEEEAEPTEPRTRGSADVVIEFLRSRNGAVAPRFIADALGWTNKSVEGHLRRLKNEGIAISPTTGYWTLAEKVVVRRPAAPPQPPPQPPPRATAPPPPPPQPKPTPAAAAGGNATDRSRAGISPQVGRILAAMVYATKTTGRTGLAKRHVEQYLAERDLRQYGARMPDMIKRGLVKKAPGTGEFQLQEKGAEAIKTARQWAWTHDGETVPDWAAHVWE